ncbi:DNA gyrase subunit A [Pseudonocardia pini]|uniref:DNA gyrase subunit A n=1 Tax=Pseudonocardia pini TaxID=2758030 RepID=UPI0015F0552A|nr:DNA gyrase subunit A [Pseudonocardia pini]
MRPEGPQFSPEEHAEQLRLARERLAQLESLDLALGRWREVVEAIAASANRAEAVAALRGLLGVDENGAHSIVQLQWARLTRDTVGHIRQEIEEIRRDIDQLGG